jgi:hypothetical protein
MNRCNAFLPKPQLRRQLLVSALAMPLLVLPSLASAQLGIRPFPPSAERGTLVVTNPPVIQLNGKPDRLSPGSRIRGQNNMLVLSGSVIGQALLVNFVRTPTGEVHEVWVLTPAEAALKLPTQQQ